MTTPSFPSLPTELALMEGPVGLLARAAPASAAPFALSGRRALAWGTAMRGVDRIVSAGWTLLGDLQTGCGPAATVVVGPSSLRRETFGRTGSLIETLLVPEAVAGAALQWSAPVGSSRVTAITLAWTVTRDGPEMLSYAVDPDGVWIWTTLEGTTASAQPAALALLRPRPLTLEVQPQNNGTLRIVASLEALPGAHLTLLLAAGASAEHARSALRALAGVRAQEARLEQTALVSRAEGLATQTGVPALDEGIEWAKARIRGAVAEERGVWRIRRGGGACAGARPEEQRPGAADSPYSAEVEPVWVALGALAAGNPEPARILLEAELPTVYHLLLAGRYVAWSGDAAALLPHRERLAALAEGPATNGPAAATNGVALTEISHALDALGEKALAERLRARATAAKPTTGVPAAGRRLPMAGTEQGRFAADEGELLGALLETRPGILYRDPVAPPATSVERALRAWALAHAGDPDAGYLLLREHLDAGFESGVGMWHDRADGAAVCPDHAASAALVPAVLLFGLLGARADALVGRLRLAPRLPSSWTTFSVNGIRVGDARVALRYTRSGEAEQRFEVRQEGGRTPLMLIFEPEVPGSALLEARVDGATAELDSFARGGRIGVRVQLPLDSERRVVLRAARASAL